MIHCWYCQQPVHHPEVTGHLCTSCTRRGLQAPQAGGTRCGTGGTRCVPDPIRAGRDSLVLAQAGAWMKVITAKVAHVLDQRRLVLNAGEEAGIRVGMLFEVLARTSESITDPDSGEHLADIYPPVATVIIRSVTAKIAVCLVADEQRLVDDLILPGQEAVRVLSPSLPLRRH